jgi:hypothetical protein
MTLDTHQRRPNPLCPPLETLRYFEGDQFAAENVKYLDGGNETEAEEETEDAADAADERNLGDFFFGDVF